MGGPEGRAGDGGRGACRAPGLGAWPGARHTRGGARWLGLAGYGVEVLPTRPLGVALVAFGIAGLAVALQSGAPRVWTAIGLAAVVVGSFRLYSSHHQPWWTIALLTAGVVLFV